MYIRRRWRTQNMKRQVNAASLLVSDKRLLHLNTVMYKSESVTHSDPSGGRVARVLLEVWMKVARS